MQHWTLIKKFEKFFDKDISKMKTKENHWHNLNILKKNCAHNT